MRRKRDHVAPAQLSAASKALWNQLVPDRVKSPGRLQLLRTALEDLDLMDEARALLRAEGHVFTTARTGTLHAHPALHILRDAHLRFLAAWEKLRLVFDEEMDDQP